MTAIIPMFIILTILSMIFFLIVRNIRYKALAEERSRIAPVLLLISAVLLSLEFIIGGGIYLRMAFDLTLLMPAFLFLSSTIWKPGLVRLMCAVSFLSQLCAIVYQILCLVGVNSIMENKSYMLLFVLPVLWLGTVSVYGIWRRLMDIRSVMKGGTVLVNLGLSVDFVYFVMISVVPVLILVSNCFSGLLSEVLQCIAALCGISILAAQCVRISFGSFFALMHDHERRIVESLKISQVEMANRVKEDTYRELYERIVTYFEEDKPFLDNNLTINDVVKVVFSNRVYISRAISQFTGRNFCQFVNYYRISYSKECFRENPELKVTEMAGMSGFNSVVTYNMAFRLFMNENPGEWCRKERQKIRKKKK